MKHFHKTAVIREANKQRTSEINKSKKCEVRK